MVESGVGDALQRRIYPFFDILESFYVEEIGIDVCVTIEDWKCTLYFLLL